MPLHFRSKVAYRKWLGYKFIHGLKTKHHRVVYIAGRKHKVRHI